MKSKKIVSINKTARLVVTYDGDLIDIETQTLERFLFFFKTWEYSKRLSISIISAYNGKMANIFYPCISRVQSNYRSWNEETWPANMIDIKDRINQVKTEYLSGIQMREDIYDATVRAFNRI